MTAADLHDLCIVKTLHYRALLNTAFVGHSGYNVQDVAEQHRQSLLLWEQIAAVGDYAALTPEQQLVVDLAAAR